MVVTCVYFADDEKIVSVLPFEDRKMCKRGKMMN